MKVEIEIPDERIAYLLCSAWEGGSSYWTGQASGLPYATEGPMRLLLDEPITITIEADLGDENNGKKQVLTEVRVEELYRRVHEAERAVHSAVPPQPPPPQSPD